MSVEIERRGFLGSVIGLVGAAALPFRAIPAVAEKSYDYRLAMWTDHGFIWAPPVKITREANKRVLYTEIDITGTFVYRGCSCVNPEGLVVGAARFFRGQVAALAGDQLKVTYTINSPRIPFSKVQPRHAEINRRTKLLEQPMGTILTLEDIKRLC